MKRGHVVPEVHAVPNGVRMLRRKTFVPELKVLLVFVTERTAVPVADVAAVVDPTIETLYEGFVVPTPTAPEKVDVPVDEVATTVPVINRP
jgi:hypothetical protein